MGSAPATSHPRSLAIIPAFNEEANLGRLLAETRGVALPLDFVVIDDGSTDGTADAAAAVDAAVLRMPFNCGIGGAVQAGIRFGLSEGYDWIVRLDGDGQHDPLAIPTLLEPLRDNRADFVIGSRYLEGEGFQSTRLRRVGIRWFSLLLRIVSGVHISDPTSGFWAANRRAAVLLAEEYASDYPEVDSVLRLQRQGRRICEVPVVMRARPAGASSIDAPRALYYMLKVTLALAIVRLRPAA
jgi:glycosyltransferase involved in cell wall biosynthesis